MKKAIASLFIILILMSFVAHGTEQINEKNWASHPKINEIRKIYKDIEGLISSGKLKGSQREFEYCEPYIDTNRKMYVDKKGRVRKYVNSKGSDDSAVTQSFYYDVNGTLRFVFAECGAANETKLEVRVYFDEKGTRLWENHKLIHGPGYTFPNPWPEDELVLNPKETFESQNKCNEKK